MNAQPDTLNRQERWPLDRGAGTLAAARGYTRDFLRAAPETPQTVVQDALIVVTELVSNAVRHAPGPSTLELVERAGLLTIAVTDTDTSAPRPRAADLEAGGGGFGWHLLERLSLRVQVQLDPPRGKTVSATLPMRRPLSLEAMAE
ncbi:ATP-binding protein [Streptacidiphilus sp. P02-A3a]|uniref:ATP-binding protein n=1 Tax=Streptacidiphilus sp. P02-A3a TaxID=2704468 RepID=UPI0015F933A5|nr:ATP-binding protein [Streptacidiphilus sp. P02-A3a]QMU69316.1 ATP-binding protein [Streptacidiphilus sp. P02-A3a]